MRFVRVFVGAILALASVSKAEESLTSAQIRAAMQSERSKISNGRFVASGFVTKTREATTTYKGSIHWKYEFDLAVPSFLFDRDEWHQPNLELRTADTDRLRTFFCEDRVAKYTYSDLILPIAVVHIHDKKDFSTKLDGQYQRLDVRGLGFYNFNGLVFESERGDRAFFEHHFVKDLGEEIQVAKEASDIYQLSFATTKLGGFLPLKISLWVDRSKGFAPVRCVAYQGDRVELESQTDWELMNGVWVPRRLTGKSKVPFLPDGKEFIDANLEYNTEEFELEISWQGLNEDRKLEDYDFKLFDFPKGTQVYKNGQMVHAYGYKMPERNSKKTESSQSRRRFLFPILFGTLIVLVSTFFWFSRKARSE